MQDAIISEIQRVINRIEIMSIYKLIFDESNEATVRPTDVLEAVKGAVEQILKVLLDDPTITCLHDYASF